MSLTVDGVWKAGVWATTVWANGVWFEGAPVPTQPTALIWGDGLRQWNRKIRGRTIPDEVCEIIAEIVEAAPPPVVLADTGKIAKSALARQEKALRAELQAQGIAWHKYYREALTMAYEQQAEDDAICVLLLFS